jgi:hypothetical protein
LTQAITPATTGSRIVVLISFTFAPSTSAAAGFAVKVLRDAATAYISTDMPDIYYASAATRRLRVSYQFIDSPSTASSTTYTVQVANWSSGQITWNNNSEIGSMILMEVGA